MATRDAETIRGTIDEISGMLGENAGRLRLLSIDLERPAVEIALDLDEVDCEECVLPSEGLRATIADALAGRLGRPVQVGLRDPRIAEPASAKPPAGQVTVLDPTGITPDDGEADPGPDAGPLRGKTVAIRHDVLWPSFDWTVDEWQHRLESAGAKVLTWRRVQGLVGSEYDRAQAEYESMLASADVGIAGLANCGSCTSWSVRDALTAASHGLPTTVVATAHFEPLARLLAAEAGRPGLRIVVLPYPYDTLPEEDVRAHARAAFPRLVEVLGASL